jgi:glycosyltransferase involved in cell wall biosynthesis
MTSQCESIIYGQKIVKGNDIIAGSVMNPFLSLVIPAYNEEDCIADVLHEVDAVLRESGFSFELIAVQNGSSDRTGDILRELEGAIKVLKVVDVPVNRGFGYGVIRGLQECTGEIIGYMPGDGQIPPATVPLLLEKMQKERAQIGKGCRVVRNDGWMRKLVTLVYNSFVRMLFGLPTSDVNSNPKLMTRFAYQSILPGSHDFFIDPEIMLKAQKLGFKFSEVEVVSPKRDKGRSKLSVLRVGFRFAINLMIARFSKRDPWGIHSITRAQSAEFSQQR